MGISIWQLLIVALIVILIFGTKRLKNVGKDVGDAVKSFKNAVNDADEKGSSPTEKKSTDTDSSDQK